MTLHRARARSYQSWSMACWGAQLGDTTPLRRTIGPAVVGARLRAMKPYRERFIARKRAPTLPRSRRA
ncbi:hypothetical protein TR80_005000 [Xanthomonas campestris]|nr:hypothetical protein TR80_005000 [Xanthomonas campestris]